jgi:hypothetical protein
MAERIGRNKAIAMDAAQPLPKANFTAGVSRI